MEIEYTCPLGHTCEKAVDGKVQRCAWYVKLEGVDPMTGKEVSERRCSMAWQPILMVEGHKMMNTTNASVQSLRNETVKRQTAALEVLKNAQISSNS